MSYSPQNIQTVNLGFVEIKLLVSPRKYKKAPFRNYFTLYHSKWQWHFKVPKTQVRYRGG